MKRKQVYLTEESATALKRLAQAQGRTESDSRLAFAFLDAIFALQSSYELQVAYVDASLARMAESILRQYAGVKLSYVDATALAWLRGRPSVDQVFGDDHWWLEGHVHPVVGDNARARDHRGTRSVDVGAFAIRPCTTVGESHVGCAGRRASRPLGRS